jgi:hypothetical protein
VSSVGFDEHAISQHFHINLRRPDKTFGSNASEQSSGASSTSSWHLVPKSVHRFASQYTCASQQVVASHCAPHALYEPGFVLPNEQSPVKVEHVASHAFVVVDHKQLDGHVYHSLYDEHALTVPFAEALASTFSRLSSTSAAFAAERFATFSFRVLKTILSVNFHTLCESPSSKVRNC